MKRKSNLFTQVASLENLLLADRKAQKGKANQYGVRLHNQNREANIQALNEMLLNKTYKTSPYSIFKVYEPKERDVFRLPYLPDRNPIFDSKGFSTENPLGVIIATRRHWHYLVNPQFGNGGASIDKPCFTLIAKMDKRPPYLVEAEGGEIAIEVYETDSPMTVQIKKFMAAYGLVDIKMRMLRVIELLRIQGFPEDYKMVGTQADHKKFIGNSVVPTVPQKWAEALAGKLLERKVKVA